MNRQELQERAGFLCAAVMSALIVSACAGSPETRVVQKTPSGPGGNVPRPEISQPGVIQPALNTISARIRSHEARLDEIRDIENSPNSMMIPHEQMGRLSACKSELLDILTNYDALQKKLLQETDQETAQSLASETLLQVNQQDMEFIEGGCGRLLSELKGGQGMTAPPPATAQTPATQPASYAEADPQIQSAFDAGEYARVISLYNQQWTGLGQSPAPLTTWQYGQSLLKNHQPEEAERVLSGLDTQLGQGGDPLASDVLRALGDIAFSAGNYDVALQRYERLVRLPNNQGDSWTQRQLAVLQQQSASADELSAYATLVRNYLAYTPSRDGYAVAEQAEQFLSRYPASRLVANVNTIHKQTREEADAWLNRGVQRIEQRRMDGGTAPTTGVSTGAATAPAGSDAAQAPLSPEQTAARNQALQEQFDRGIAHMAAKEYDQALGAFTPLLGSDFDGQARERIRETAALAGEDNRQKAAELFVRASQTQDPESRKKLLLASRQLLKDILVKYPHSSLNSKVERNLASVEQALRAIDPSLPDTASGAAPTGQGF